MMPTVLMGSFIGVWFNIMLPEIAIQIILALLLFFLTFQAGIKARQIYTKENKALKTAQEKGRKSADNSRRTKESRSSSKLGLAPFGSAGKRVENKPSFKEVP
jgi:uncharacterized membrane protein YfcA